MKIGLNKVSQLDLIDFLVGTYNVSYFSAMELVITYPVEIYKIYLKFFQRKGRVKKL